MPKLHERLQRKLVSPKPSSSKKDNTAPTLLTKDKASDKTCLQSSPESVSPSQVSSKHSVRPSQQDYQPSVHSTRSTQIHTPPHPPLLSTIIPSIERDPLAELYVSAHPDPEVKARRSAYLERIRKQARHSMQEKSRLANRRWRNELLAHKDDHTGIWATLKWTYDRPDDMNLWGDNHQSRLNSPPADSPSEDEPETKSHVKVAKSTKSRKRKFEDEDEDDSYNEESKPGLKRKHRSVKGLRKLQRNKRVKYDTLDGVKDKEEDTDMSCVPWFECCRGSSAECAKWCDDETRGKERRATELEVMTTRSGRVVHRWPG